MTGTMTPPWPLSAPFLGAEEVHVWRVDLDPQPALEGLEPCLSSDEQARAGVFAFARDRRRYCVSHVALRSILARYLAVHPQAVRFAQGPQEKPYLVGGTDLRFNLSHSGDLAVVAVARGREVGVDLEQVRELDDLEGLAEDCFAPPELSAWRALPRDHRPAAFFATWTRKEAYLKAGGVGLSRSLQSFEVSVLPGERPRLLRVLDDPGEPARWTLKTLTFEPGFAATVAIEGRARVTLWTWNPREENGAGRQGRPEHLYGGGERRGAALDLAREEAPAERLASGGQDRKPVGLPGPHKRGLDRPAPGEPSARVAAPASARPTTGPGPGANP
jgi:4'-phosphopantetheinyl transferase